MGELAGAGQLCHLAEGIPFRAGVYRVPSGLMKETPSSPSISGSLFEAALPPVPNQRRVERREAGGPGLSTSALSGACRGPPGAGKGLRVGRWGGKGGLGHRGGTWGGAQ